MKVEELRKWLTTASTTNGPIPNCIALTELQVHELMGDIDRKRRAGVTAPADSELGIELSKIRDRLNVLENTLSAVSKALTGS